MNLSFNQKLISLLLLIVISTSCNDQNDIPIPAEPYMISGTGLRVGVAQADITPSKDIILAGYGPRDSDGVHDRISARCMSIIDPNDKILVLISLDLIGMFLEQTNEMKNMIAAYTGLEKECIFIHCTHSHSGPEVLLNPNETSSYLKGEFKKIGQAVRESLENSQSSIAIFSKGTSRVETVNRRNPEKSVNNSFTHIQFVDQNQNTIAALLNFACHPVVLGPDNDKISADYIYYLRRYVEQNLGGTAVFFNGSQGDINPPPIKRTYPYDRSGGTFEMSQTFGEQLGYDILNNISATDTAEIEIDYITKTIAGSNDLRGTEISIVNLGIAQIAMFPGESLSGLGSAVQDMLPGKYPMTFGLTNDFIGYIIPQDEWEGCSHSFKSTCYEETNSVGIEVGPMAISGFEQIAKELFP